MKTFFIREKSIEFNTYEIEAENASQAIELYEDGNAEYVKGSNRITDCEWIKITDEGGLEYDTK